MLFLLATTSLYGETFSKTKMYAEQEHKLRLRKVQINLQDDALVVKGTTKHYVGTMKAGSAPTKEIRMPLIGESAGLEAAMIGAAGKRFSGDGFGANQQRPHETTGRLR